MMEVRRRRAKPQDGKHNAHLEHDADASTDHSRTIQRDKGDVQVTSDISIENKKENPSNSTKSKQSVSSNTVCARIRISLEIDLIAAILLIAGICTRLYRLEEPRSIVFDELHYGKYVGLYMKRTFFFDSHPPLGKQLVSAAAYLAGFDGQFKFDRIGSPYSDTIPLYALRLVPAICGSLLIPTGYHLVLELGLRQWAAAIAGILLLFGNFLLAEKAHIKIACS